MILESRLFLYDTAVSQCVVIRLGAQRFTSRDHANQRMYLLAQPNSQGLSRSALHIIFTAIVLSAVTYTLRSFDVQK